MTTPLLAMVQENISACEAEGYCESETRGWKALLKALVLMESHSEGMMYLEAVMPNGDQRESVGKARIEIDQTLTEIHSLIMGEKR